MLNALARPLMPIEAAAAGAALVGGGALYCVGYTFLAGSYENPLEAAAWATANLLPWLAAFELAKRFRAGWPTAAILIGAGLLSLLLEHRAGLYAMGAEQAAFQLLRRLPGAALVLLLLLLGRSSRIAKRAAERSDELPLLPHQIDWIKAAGNYLEFHSGAAMAMRRMTVSEAQARLAPHGFVRIHRSVVVNAARIARIRPGKGFDEVELDDGRRLKVGDAYRDALRGLERQRAA